MPLSPHRSIESTGADTGAQGRGSGGAKGL